MLRNYLTIALRNLAKRKGYTLLNILGLTIGMTCCLLIFHYVSYERSYDEFESAKGDFVRVRLDSYQKGELQWKSATSYPAIAPTLKKDFPEVANVCRLVDANVLFATDDLSIKSSETKGYFADTSFVDMFNVQMARGDRNTALDGPYKMIISEKMAKKYFGKDNPVGKRLSDLQGGEPRSLQISGVFRDFPHNSHLTVEYIISYSTYTALNNYSGNPTETSWGWYDFYTYIRLKPGAEWKQLQAKMPAFCDTYMNNREWNKKNNFRYEIHLLPVQDIHLYSNYNQEAEVNGDGQAVGFLFLVALFIIGIAWINYINLATARSVERAREVGMRKVLGATRSNLIRQFLVESFLLNCSALLLSIILFLALLTGFDYFTGRDIITGMSLTSAYWLIFGAVFLGGTILSGVYPAFVLSGFQPITVLKGVFKNNGFGLSLRKGLIVLQFLTSVVLIAGTIIVYQQVSFMRREKLGVNINQTLVLRGSRTLTDSLYQATFQPFKNELLQQPGVKSVVASTSVMGDEIYWTQNIKALLPEAQGYTLYHVGIDYDFIPAFGLKLVAGRNFSRDITSDSRAVLLNEAGAALLGFNNPEAAAKGKIIRGGDTLNVIGVVSNYHHMGLQKAIDPMIFLFSIYGNYSVKVETANLQKTIAAAQKTWSKYFPNDPFNYYFLDESFNQQYKADALFGKVFGIFAFLAILIASFGLLGLSAYNVLQRTKEIGIRKVLGASVQSILLLLSKDFLKLILVALVMAIPIGWFIMHQWLQDFAYRINIAWWVFGIAGIGALLIAVLTISLQALRAVTDNPVKSLRTE